MPKEGQKVCQICGGSHVFNHYGATSCRACGAFFRRLIIMGANYECKYKNNGNHPLGSDIVGCKGCRWKKSVKAASATWNWQSNRKHRKAHLAIENQNLINGKIDSEEKLFQRLLKLNELAENLQKSVSIRMVRMEYFEQFPDLESLLMDKNNLLANSDSFLEKKNLVQSFSFDKDEFLKFVHQNGVFALPNPIITAGLLISLNLAKTFSSFDALERGDKICLLKASTWTCFFAFGNYFSANWHSESLLKGQILFPIYSQQYPDPVILSASERIFLHPTLAFKRVDLAKDEFALLMALLFTNSAIPGLSPQGQQILKGEEEKYGKMLLGLQQRRFGENAGALRYMETLRLLWTTIRQMQKHHEIAIYIDTLYGQGKFDKIVPNTLKPLI